MKRIVEWIMGNLDGTLSVDASNPTVQHGGSVVYDIRSTSKIPFVQGKANDLSIINSIKNVR